MKLGIHFGDFTLPGAPESLGHVLSATAKAADDGGCAVFTLLDHWFQMEAISRPEDPMLEGYTSLGFLAGRTERITLGLLVSGVTYRQPGLLVKIVTTLDVLSGGRAQLGLGAAWYEREHLGLGVPFPPLGERFERLEEALQIALQMWSDDDGPLRRPVLPARRDDLLAAAAPAPTAPDRGGRRGRAQDPAAGGAVRRRLQPGGGEP